jgi:hypothetical protein
MSAPRRSSVGDYHFVTRWHLQASCDEVRAILDDAEGLARWWPSVYLEVKVIERGDRSSQIGDVVALRTKGFLPYTLRWMFRVTESRGAGGFSLEASGDFVGRGIWSFEQEDSGCAATFDWRIRVDKPLIQRLTPVLRPIFAANHRWAMARGEESLRLELARRRARTEEERAEIPPPPGPTFPHNVGRRRAATRAA